MSFLDRVRQHLRDLEGGFDPELSGARSLDRSRVSEGVNLFDGRLMDMDGKILKTWNSAYLSLLLPDGRYAAQASYESKRWGLYTWDDEVVWEKDFAIHHDIALTSRGNLLTLTKEARPYKGRLVDFCVIVEFDPEGRETDRWSTWDHLKELQSFHRPLELDRPKMFFLPEPPHRKQLTPWGGNFDYYRINSIQELPETELGRMDSRFRAGNWLISIRHGSMLFIIDRTRRNVVWKCIHRDVPQNLEGQHSARMLPTGRILLFDNGRYRGWSRAIEIDPITLKIEWEYKADDLFSLSQGCVQRLPNGNTLITVSEQGRIIEVAPNAQVVWEYHHPEQQNAANSLHPENYGKRQWIYRMVRYPQGYLNFNPG
jgi:hypothetical protein